MKRTIFLLLGLLLMLVSHQTFADTPLVSYRYLADPASLVYNGRVYLFCSNDDDNPTGNDGSYQMRSIVCVSSADMKNWTDHGIVFQVPENASWAGNSWAPSVVARNGNFYMYFGNNASGIGVAVADSPTGPYTDPLGQSLIDSNTPGVQPADNIWIFDPMTFVDDDGQAYMYFGGNGENNLRVVKLNDDMISIDGAATQFYVPYFFEAAWMHKYNGTYYFSYSTDSNNGIRIDYMTSDNPTTGFTYQGVLSGNPPQNNNNNNHQAIFEFNGQWYQAYHNRKVAIEAGVPDGYKRSLAIDKIFHQQDGTIAQMVNTEDGVDQIGYLDPYIRVEAETMSRQYGIETEVSSAGGMNIGYLDNDDWIKISGVDFGNIGADGFSASVASIYDGGTIEIRLDDSNGSVIGTLSVPNTGDYQTWETSSIAVNQITGVHDVYFTFKGSNGGLFNIDHWRFSEATTSTNSSVWLEAECGTVGGLFNEVSEANASGGNYVTVQAGNNSTSSAPTDSEGQVTYAFDVEDGDFVLWARVITPNGNDDSFWIQVDGGAWLQWNDVGPNANWTWEQVNSYALSTGSHTLTIAYREDGALLDKLYISANGDTPTGEGDSASNCEGQPTQYTLSVNSNSSTSGSVSLSPSGGTYDEGTVVTVSANPEAGYQFDNWSGDVSSSDASVQITMDSNKSVTANFSEISTGADDETITVQENAEGFCLVDGSIDSNHEGYTGAGFANTSNANGQGVEWAIHGDQGTYTFTWRFANGSATNRTGVLYINGAQVTTVDFNSTGGWTTWETTSVTVNDITEGFKTIRLEANQGSGLSNIDYIEVTGPAAAVSNCDGSVNAVPVANAGSDQTVTDSDGNGNETLTLDGSLSTDSDGSIASYVWRENGSEIATGVSPSVSFSVGTHTIVLTVTDNEGASSTDEVIITVDEAVTTDNISVRALGTSGNERLELEIDGAVVVTWTMSTSYEIYTYTGPTEGVFRVNFTNDGDGNDVQVDYLEVSGTTYQAEDQSINTAYYANNACGGGSNSELMHCNGYIEFNTGGVCADTDGDGTDDCSDSCPNDPNKVSPGECGCGFEAGSCDDLQFAIPGGNQGLAACKAKYVGNIMPSSWQGDVVRSDFGTYWNQVTQENAGKWGVVEGTRDNYSWGDMDEMYAYAQENNIPFKHHVFIWGSQQPDWLSSLSADEQREEVEEWYSLFAERYPETAIIDVVNESLPGHAPDVAVRDALGGFNDGDNNPYLSSHPEYGPYGTGWDYIIYAFAKAREYFPNAILLLNDYNIINNTSNINTHLGIVNILRQRGLIDAVGIQAHTFSVNTMSGSQITNNLNLLDDAGLPIHVTELDITGDNGDEVQQRDRYAEIFPAFYEHPAVAGVTLWGYVEGQTWKDYTGILNADGSERLAMQWLKEYMSAQPDVCNTTLLKVNKDTENLVKIYPNPVTDVVNLALNTTSIGEITVSILSSGGVEVRRLKLLDSTARIDVSDLPNGLYFVKVSGDHFQSITKIMK